MKKRKQISDLETCLPAGRFRDFEISFKAGIRTNPKISKSRNQKFIDSPHLKDTTLIGSSFLLNQP
jgi:hypothetical protein